MATGNIRFGLMEMSAVNEMANIGLGHATTALSEMTGHCFTMSIPSIDSIPVATIPSLVGGPETTCLGVFMPIGGDLEGHIAFLFPWKSAQRLWDMLLGQYPAEPGDVGEMEASAMLEIGNILNSSFLNAISDMTGMSLLATPPLVSIEMSSAIVQSIVAEAEQNDVIALAIETCIYSREEETQGFFLCIPTVSDLKKLFRTLGIPEAA